MPNIGTKKPFIFILLFPHTIKSIQMYAENVLSMNTSEMAYPNVELDSL